LAGNIHFCHLYEQNMSSSMGSASTKPDVVALGVLCDVGRSPPSIYFRCGIQSASMATQCTVGLVLGDLTRGPSAERNLLSRVWNRRSAQDRLELIRRVQDATTAKVRPSNTVGIARLRVEQPNEELRAQAMPKPTTAMALVSTREPFAFRVSPQDTEILLLPKETYPQKLMLKRTSALW
jgi:hypothetical protein